MGSELDHQKRKKNLSSSISLSFFLSLDMITSDFGHWGEGKKGGIEIKLCGKKNIPHKIAHAPFFFLDLCRTKIEFPYMPYQIRIRSYLYLEREEGRQWGSRRDLMQTYRTPLFSNIFVAQKYKAWFFFQIRIRSDFLPF